MNSLPEVLRDQYEELRRKNPAFSLRAYSRRLHLNSGVLSAVMRGDRPVTAKWTEKVLPRLGLSPAAEQEVRENLVARKIGQGQLKVQPRALRLKADEFNLISDSLHFSLLALFDLHDFTSRVSWMAKRLKRSEREINDVLSRLERLKLIEKKGARWVATGAVLRTSDGVSDMAIKKFHEQSLESAKNAIYEVDVKDRDLLCSSVAIQRAKLPLARKLVRDFLLRLETALSEGPADEVYRIGFQLIPVTDLESEKEK